MAEAPSPAPSPDLPGVRTGNPDAPGVPVTPAPPLGDRPSDGTPGKLPFGGNVGRKPRADGLKPGSPEAIEADRKRDADRKRRERAEKRAATAPPVLPAATAPLPLDPPAPGAPVDIPQDGGAVAPAPDPVGGWTAEDFTYAAPELVELAEMWRVNQRTKEAVDYGFPRPVVEEYAKRTAFPPKAKASLSKSSAPVLADLFNTLKLPLKLKPAVATFPALVFLIARDFMIGREMAGQAAEEKARQPEPEKPHEQNT